MPELNGFELLKKIKDKNPHQKVIALTAFALSDEIATIREAGFDDIITKPFSKQTFISQIFKYLVQNP